MGDVTAEEAPSESDKADSSRTRIIQVVNVSPSATLEQLSTLFSYLGDISKIDFFQPDQTPENNSKVCFVQFASSSSVLMAQHLTNTVFIDRALTVIPYDKPIFPNQDSASVSIVSNKYDKVREHDKKNDHGRYKYHNRPPETLRTLSGHPRDSHSRSSRSREIIQRRSRSSERILRRSRSKDRDYKRRSRSKDRDHRRRSRSKERDYKRRSRSKDRDYKRRSRSKDKDHRRRSRSKDRDHRRRSKSRESKRSSRVRSSDRSKTKRHKS